MPLCDTVLRLAALGLFEAYWSEAILTEVGRTLAKFGKSEAQVERRLSQMRQAFPEAIVEGFEFLIPAMTNDEKDRHVLAAAVRAGVNQVVTQNTRDFPQESADPYEIEISEPAFAVVSAHFAPLFAKGAGRVRVRARAAATVAESPAA